jgi:uncharacterized protein YkwD
MISLSTIAIFLAVGPLFASEQPLAAALITAHNRERAERKLPPLVAEPRLTEAARLHAQDMASHSKMGHEGSDGSSSSDRIKRQKYPYITTGENVADGQTTVVEVMKSWMASPHHRENILGDFTEIGVARAESKDGTPYWCVDFGRPFPKLDPEKAEAEFAERLNHARSDGGKEPIRVDARLARAARAIATDFAAKGSLKPADPSDKSKTATPDRIAESGYAYSKATQSSAYGLPTPEAVLRSLMDSADQKATLLGPYTNCGVGYALAEDGRPFWCVVLASPRD